MNTTTEEGIAKVQDAIEKLRNGTATQEEVQLVKEYVEVVEEMIILFDESVSKTLTKNNL